MDQFTKRALTLTGIIGGFVVAYHALMIAIASVTFWWMRRS